MKKTRVVIFCAFVLLALIGTTFGYGSQGSADATCGKTAYAAEVTDKTIQTKKKTPVRFEDVEKSAVRTSSFGSLVTVAVYHIENKICTDEQPVVKYQEISTEALAKKAIETLEKETLQLMASPAGASWGGMIKVYAGETPLLITEEDKEVLLRIVEAEATCEDVEGRMLVANVILNRVVSKSFPNTIAEVVFQNNGQTYQFSPIKDGRYWKVKVSEETREAVERVLAGEDMSQGALFFVARSMANKKAMRWFDTSLQFLFRHGVHEFFTYK